MPIAPLTARWAEPGNVPALATFACGGSAPHELEVDDLVHQVHARNPGEIRIAEDAVGNLAGLCYFVERPLGPFLDAAYVALIAVAADFRGKRVGDFVLRDALECISTAVGGHMPLVWAMIDPKNHASHRLFERHDFLDVLHAHTENNSAYDWRIRAPGLPV